MLECGAQEENLPITTDQHNLYRLARLGAVARLQELEAEAAAIRKMFPGLKNPHGVVPESPAPAASPKARTRKKRKKMSADARRAVSQRMTAYWAAKKQEAGPQAEAAADTNADDSEPAPRARKTKKKSGANKQHAKGQK